MESQERIPQLRTVVRLDLAPELDGTISIGAKISDDGQRLVIVEDRTNVLTNRLIAAGVLQPSASKEEARAVLESIVVGWDQSELTAGNTVWLDVVVNENVHRLYKGILFYNGSYVQRHLLPTPEPQLA